MDVYIIAGPNGVGKTSFARKFLPKYANCTNFINADLIAQGMSPFSPEAATIRAGSWSLAKFDSSHNGEFPLPLRLHCQAEAICA